MTWTCGRSWSSSGQAGATIQVTCGRYHLVPTPAGPLPDPIVPLGATAPLLPRDAGGRSRAIESADSTAGALSQNLHVELYVPHDVPAGTRRGTLTLHSGRESLAPGGRSDGLGFHAAGSPQLPARDELLRPARERARLLPPGPPPPDGPEPAALQPERPDAGRLRPALGRQRGSTGRAGTAGSARLLDGSAFADLPRKGVPVECFYLPLHENWPSPMEGNYNGSYWADQAFPESYRRAFVSASRQIAEHLQARGWTDTLFQGFLNNKNNFKASGWSRGSSPWLLDEPANFQDYWALRYFARAFHEGINQARPRAKQSTAGAEGASFPRLVFRVDNSRPQWRRDASTACWITTWSARRCGSIPAWSSTASAGSARSWSSTAGRTRSRLEPPAGRLVPRRLVAGGRRRPALADDRHSPVVAAGRRAVAVLPASGRRPRRGPPGQIDEPAGCRARRGAIDPAQGLSPRAAGRRVPDALVATVRSAPRDGRPAGPRRRCTSPAHARRPRPVAPRTPAGSITPAFAPRICGLCACASARPCPWLIQHPSPGSSIFALRHAIRLRAGRD